MSPKRTHHQKRADELKRVQGILLDIDSSEDDVRSIDLSLFHGDARRCIEEIKKRAVHYLERKDQPEADQLADWFVSKADTFHKRFGNELN